MIRLPIYTENRQAPPPPPPPPPYNGNRLEEMVLEQENNLEYYEHPNPNIVFTILGMLIFFLLGLFMYLFFLFGQSTIQCEATKVGLISPIEENSEFPQFTSSTYHQPTTTSSTYHQLTTTTFTTYAQPNTATFTNHQVTTNKRQPLNKFIPKESHFEGVWGPYKEIDIVHPDNDSEGSGVIADNDSEGSGMIAEV